MSERSSGAAAFGVYVHIPFCRARCDYCAFATWTDRAHLIEDYVAACAADVTRRHGNGALRTATSVFFGGGTPSLLSPDQLARILDAVPRSSDAEVTIECNPDDVTPATLAGYRRAGVTRISLGVQSTDPEVLALLGRTHEPATVAPAVQSVRDAGFPTFSIDLIYGAAGEASSSWATTVDGVLALDPPHVSAYGLTVEPTTRLAERIRGGEAPPDPDDQANKYELADARLEAAGLHWYEVSNWARPGHECRHNRLYWEGSDYAGIGCAAHGHAAGRRSWNVRTPERYIAAVEAGRSTEIGAESLDSTQRAEESLMLGLRTRRGVPVPPGRADAVTELAEAGLVERHGDRVRLSRRGRLLATEVTLRLSAPSVSTR